MTPNPKHTAAAHAVAHLNTALHELRVAADKLAEEGDYFAALRTRLREAMASVGDTAGMLERVGEMESGE